MPITSIDSSETAGRTGRRVPWRTLLAAMVIGPLLVTVLAAFVDRGEFEDLRSGEVTAEPSHGVPRAAASRSATPEQVTPSAAPRPTFDRQALQQQLNDLIAASPITFRPDTSQLTADGAATVANIAGVLGGVPAARIEVDGHVADTSGPDPNAQALSEQRANAVKDRLVELGVDARRVDAVGFGTTRPVASNDTSAGQAANRRVEVVVLEEVP